MTLNGVNIFFAAQTNDFHTAMDDDTKADLEAAQILVEFDSLQRRLLFHGDCEEMRPICQAMCCRTKWHIDLSPDEYRSGRYKANVMCTLTDKECRDAVPPCSYRRYRVARKKDGSCEYLEKNRCSIYSDRPQTCRDFQCHGGWKIMSAVFLPEDGTPDAEQNKPFRETFIQTLHDDQVFVSHPLLKLHTVFYRKHRKDIIFVKEMVGACGKFHTRDNFDYMQLEDTHILRLIELVNQKEPLGLIYQKFLTDYPGLLTEKEFYEIIWLLNKHSIVLDSRNFQGMLAGMGNNLEFV